MVMDLPNRQTIDEDLQGLIQYQFSDVIITSGTPSENIGKAFIKHGTLVVLVNRAEHSDEADIVNLEGEGLLKGNPLLVSASGLKISLNKMTGI